MHGDYVGPQLLYVRAGSAIVWRKLYAHRSPSAQVYRNLDIGETVQFFNYSNEQGSMWAKVDTVQFVGTTRVNQPGFLRVPIHDPSTILAPLPERRYYGEIVSGGLPSHLAVGDVIVLVEGYQGPGEAVYEVYPTSEGAPPTAGILSVNNRATVSAGPYRTPDNLLYWKISNFNGPQVGYIREYTRVGGRYRFFLRPHILANA
jgi:hypothetical protein